MAFIAMPLKVDGEIDPKVAGVYTDVVGELEYPYR